MSGNDEGQLKLLRKLTQRKKPIKPKEEPAEEKKTETKKPQGPSWLKKQIAAYTPAFLQQNKAKLAFDTMLFVGSCVIVVQFGKVLSDGLDDACPSEEKIMAEMKAQQEAMLAMQQ